MHNEVFGFSTVKQLTCITFLNFLKTVIINYEIYFRVLTAVQSIDFSFFHNVEAKSVY